MIKGILLDYGGTIDTNGIHWGVVMWNAYCKNNVPVEKEQFELAFNNAERTLALHKFIFPEHNFLDTLIIKTRLQFEFLVQNNFLAAADYSDLINTIANNGNDFAKQSIDNAKPVLDKLAAKYKLVLVSNFYGNIQTVLKHFGIEHYFAAVVESAVVGIRKPDAAIFLYGVDVLQLTPSECAVIGDSYSKDIAPGKKAGCKTIWLKGQGWGKDPDDIAAADVTIKNFSELNTVIEAIQ
jgi:FMN hydrolase / 5-amino-6-(5-phospho-D-ribitylamino)uracil phosphatase